MCRVKYTNKIIYVYIYTYVNTIYIYILICRYIYMFIYLYQRVYKNILSYSNTPYNNILLILRARPKTILRNFLNFGT